MMLQLASLLIGLTVGTWALQDPCQLSLPRRRASVVWRRTRLEATIPSAAKEQNDTPLAIPSSRLQDALEGLSEGERYNVVLQGMLRKGKATLEQEAWPLLEEMGGSGGKVLSPETRSMLVDAAASCDDAFAMERSLQLARNARGQLSRYGCELTSAGLMPPGDLKRRQELLGSKVPGKSLPVLPSDDRGVETAAALALLATFLVSLLWPLLAGSHDDGFFAWLHNPGAVGLLVAAGGAGADLFAGDGSLSAKVVAGLTRLFVRDASRECRCEAASLLVAYLTGLPSFALNPSAIEAAKILDSSPRLSPSSSSPSSLPSSSSSSSSRMLGADFSSGPGVQRLLVWLLAPVAAESAQHAQLLASDPRQAKAFLKLMRARSRAGDGGGTGAGLDDDEEGDELRLRFALGQAEEILRKHGGSLDALRTRMETGSATVGNCVTLLEKKIS